MLFYLSLLLCALQFNVAKATLEINLEDAECSEINSKYIETCELEVHDDSTYGSCVDAMIVFKEELPPETKASGRIKGYAYGDYTLDLGISIEGNLCEFTRGEASLASPVLAAVSITSDNCPPKVGTYRRDCYYPIDGAGMPAAFPEGKYQLNITLFVEPDPTILEILIYIVL